MNKLGTDKIISVYWFAILCLVAGGIFAMVYTFYHNPYDIRELEADIMVNQIANCLSWEGYLREEVFNGETFILNEENFLEQCHLNFEAEGDWKTGQYYAEVNFYNGVKNLDNPIFKISKGNKNLISNCEIQKDKEYERLAKCVEKRFYSLDKDDNQYLIKVLSVVKKTEKNVK